MMSIEIATEDGGKGAIKQTHEKLWNIIAVLDAVNRNDFLPWIV